MNAQLWACIACGNEFQGARTDRCPRCHHPETMELTQTAREAGERWQAARLLAAEDAAERQRLRDWKVGPGPEDRIELEAEAYERYVARYYSPALLEAVARRWALNCGPFGMTYEDFEAAVNVMRTGLLLSGTGRTPDVDMVLKLAAALGVPDPADPGLPLPVPSFAAWWKKVR